MEKEGEKERMEQGKSQEREHYLEQVNNIQQMRKSLRSRDDLKHQSLQLKASFFSLRPMWCVLFWLTAMAYSMGISEAALVVFLEKGREKEA